MHRLEFADAYQVASAERSCVGDIVSFDRAIERKSAIDRDYGRLDIPGEQRGHR